MPELERLPDLFAAGSAFAGSPDDPSRGLLEDQLEELLTAEPLSQIFAVFAWKWFLPEFKPKTPLAALEQAAVRYGQLGFDKV